MSNQVVEMRKVDESVIGDLQSDPPLFVIFKPDNGCILADAPYLKKWMTDNGIDEEEAAAITTFAIGGWSFQYDLKERVLVGKQPPVKLAFA